MAGQSLEQTSVEKEITVRRKVGLAHIGPAIEVDEHGNKVKDIKAEVWVSDPDSWVINYIGGLTPEELKFCSGCTTGTYTTVDMGYGEHLIQFKRQGTYRNSENPNYNYYKDCNWDINVEMGTEFPTVGEANACGVEENGLFIPRLERKEPPKYELKGTILSWELPDDIFVTDYYNYNFIIKNTSISDIDTLTAEYRITLEYRSKDLDPEKTYSEESVWVAVMKDETADITIRYAIPSSAVPSDKVYVLYDLFAVLEVDESNVTW